ncbi:MAG: hypothetical protein ABS36_01255 [Acidobacteria bacterium SCN 69-37]|nr:MAG: hypothetical protein ABS36_01255 [Acidobacteria bacterium SCN 69-37]
MWRHHLAVAVKVLLRRKIFTLVSLFGIVATLVILVLIAAMLDHGFGPGPDTGRGRVLAVMRVSLFGDGGRMMSAQGTYALFDRQARHLPGAENLAIFSSPIAADAFVDGRKQTLAMKRTDGGFWRVFSFAFLEGRPFTEADVQRADFVAVVTASARDRLLGDGPAVGRPIEIGGQRFTIVGVVPDVSEMRNLPYADVWVPLTTERTPLDQEGILGGYQAALVAGPGASIALIRETFDERVSRLELPAGMHRLVAPFETPFEGWARQMFPDDDPRSKAPRLIALLAVLGGLIALLPAVNLVNLNISRIMERSSEIGVRKAFGASSRALVAQFVVENVLLTMVGAVLALVVSAALLGVINRSGLIAHAQLAVNVRIFLIGLGLALVFGVVSGVYPAWRMSRLHPVAALKGGAR